MGEGEVGGEGEEGEGVGVGGGEEEDLFLGGRGGVALAGGFFFILLFSSCPLFWVMRGKGGKGFTYINVEPPMPGPVDA